MNSNGTQYSTGEHLGSPRVITSSSGSVVSRHDYMPFGEELGAGVGGRTTGMGFSNSGDNNRKKFTGYERDNETGLDFAEARYNSSTLGRFTSPDPFSGSMSAGDPQSFNRYAYVGNNPPTHTDPTGLSKDGGGNGSLPGDESAMGRLTGQNGVFSTESWKAAPTASSEPEAEATKDAEGGSDDGKGSDPERGTSAAQQSSSPQIIPCDQKLAGIFGGPGAVAATVNEPSTLLSPVAGIDRSNHLVNSGVFHLYTNAKGTPATTGLYTPSGGRLISGGEYYNGRTFNPDGTVKDPGKLENYFRFAYNSGALKGVQLSFVHVGGTSGGKGGGQTLGRFPGARNAAGSVRIGNIGGLGGEGFGYNHTHIKVFVNGVLTDPRKVFCK